MSKPKKSEQDILKEIRDLELLRIKTRWSIEDLLEEKVKITKDKDAITSIDNKILSSLYHYNKFADKQKQLFEYLLKISLIYRQGHCEDSELMNIERITMPDGGEGLLLTRPW